MKKQEAQNSPNMNLTLTSDIPERDLIEGLLNMKHSGISENEIVLILGLHGMANRWHIDKLIYYLNLLEIEQRQHKLEIE